MLNINNRSIYWIVMGKFEKICSVRTKKKKIILRKLLFFLNFYSLFTLNLCLDLIYVIFIPKQEKVPMCKDFVALIFFFIDCWLPVHCNSRFVNISAVLYSNYQPHSVKGHSSIQYFTIHCRVFKHVNT